MELIQSTMQTTDSLHLIINRHSFGLMMRNNKITQLSDFADTFLERSFLSRMISKYIVLAETDKVLMVLRPYQYYATERIIDRVKNTKNNGYIWHTTGSGKTLTSFKASQILMVYQKFIKLFLL